MQKALTPGGSKQQSDSFHLKEPSLNLKNNEIILIQKSLVKQQGNKQAVSEELGISRSTLWRKIEEYGL
ncbi:helix-turn-helix domain-containing protein [Geomicrobium sp. JCM 19055]|uniref:helix-turn-helix domain-containing protein n=1 Tax=Geomicrobium sp. JCM 19055 TaxID=1460649 RepID=UPI00223579C9|nr:helix-turn-helix domain-containing protein [Geomicrobium sp. JCM 19055]